MLRKSDQKVANATKTTYNGINFKSKLEVYTYKALKEAGLEFEYEVKTYTLMEGFKNINPTWEKVKKSFVCTTDRKIRAITYTPDFVSKNGSIVVENKGFSTDSYKLKAKLFKKHFLESNPGGLYLCPSNQAEVNKCIELIKKYINGN